MKTTRIADFYERHFRSYFALAIVLQVLVALIVCGSAWYALQANWLRGEVLIIAAGALFLVIETTIITITLKLFGKPFRIISDAVTHVSKEANATPPPNVNKHSYERSGLKALVQTIYELSVASFQGVLDHPGDEEGTSPEVFKEIISLMPCELIVLDKNGAVSFYHGSGGLAQLPNETMSLKLQFEKENEFNNWLEECRQQKVRDTKTWHRVPNATLGEENRKVFDVVAHYEKNEVSEVETVLLLIDRTIEYSRDEEDMDFIALAAHELRAPITVIRGYLDVLNEELRETGVLKGDQKELLDRVQVSSERLSGYINNILNVSKYDRAHLKLHLREENLASILRDIVDDLALRASTQQRQLAFRIPTGLPTIAADRSSFGEVIINLVDNAIKYSKEDGEVILSAEVKDEFVEITVQDFGIGMPENVISNLFSKFYRSHRSRQSVSGTGLGLYISKAIIESHGGKIWARSVEGEGSTFGVQVPIYSTVADKLASGNNGNESIIEESSHGWIKNHSMYRR